MTRQTTVLHMTSQKSFSKGEGDEPERRGYDEQKYNQLDRKDNLNRYDYSRKFLNFEIVKGKIVPQCSQPKPLHERLEDRLKELGFKHFKDGSENAPNYVVDFQLSGSRETMRKLAFGDQDVCYDLTRKNSGLKRMPEIEDWALDSYKFMIDKYGEKNIIGFNVHLDETNPHIHVQMVPVAQVKQRGRRKPGEEPKMKEQVSYYKLVGSTAQERKEYEENLHTEYWLKVGQKYGLQRGYFYDELSDEEKLARKHKNKHQLDDERILREKIAKQKKIISENEKTIQKQNTSMSENEKFIQKQNASIKQAETRVKGLTTMVTRLEGQLANLEEKSKEYDEVQKKLQEKRELLAKAEKQLADIENDIAEQSETAYHLTKDNEELVKKNSQIAADSSSKQALSNRLDEEIKSKQEGLRAESTTLMQRRTQKNNEARLGIIYKMWPLAVSAVQAIYNRAVLTTARMLSFQQGNSIWQALNVMPDKMEAAVFLNELTREGFIETNKPEKWFEDAAEEVLTLAENFAELSALFLVPANGQSMSNGSSGNNDLPKKKDDDREGRFYTIMSRGRKGQGRSI